MTARSRAARDLEALLGRKAGRRIDKWLPAHLAGPSNQGWLEALDKLDATLLHIQAVATDAEV
jgi:hypothetical protein